MASLITRGNTFYVQFYDSKRSPKRKRVSLKTSNKSIARELLTQFERLYRIGEADPWRDDMHAVVQPDRPAEILTLGEAFRRFLSSRRTMNCKDSTLQTYRDTVGRVIKLFGPRKALTRLTSAALRRYVHAPDVRAATREKRYRCLRTFLRFHAERLSNSPLENVERPRTEKRIPKAVQQDELQAIFRAVCSQYRALRQSGSIPPRRLVWRLSVWKFAYLTGLRRSELARLRWRHVEIGNRILILKEQKNRREERLPLSKKAARLLGKMEEGEADEYVFNSPHAPSRTDRNEKTWGQSHSRTFAKYRDKAGVRSELTLHSLRASYITQLAKAGLNAVAIKRLARHSDIKTSLRYIEATGDTFRDDLDQAFE